MNPMKYENWVFGKDGALLSACAQGDEELVKQLLADGASPCVTSPNGFTALHRAAENGHAAVVSILLDNGANPDTIADDGSSPLSAANKNGHPSVVRKIEAHA